MIARFAFLATVLLGLSHFSAFPATVKDTRPGGLPAEVNPGSLRVLRVRNEAPSKSLEFPLRHTDVSIDVSGFVAQVTVTQHYHNPFDNPIEAVYTFPLPQDAAVDRMEMRVGGRTIRGVIERRDEARRRYQQAKERGQRASLLEQERPNIFTQSVANILPGDDVRVAIRYVDLLDYADGSYELVFPMVVGPRYIPGRSTGKEGTGWAPDTDAVPDASRVTPPVLKPGERSGHDIALQVTLDAGLPIRGLHSISHAVDIEEHSASRRRIGLHPSDVIPNKDFVLRYEVAGDTPEIAVIPHHDRRGGFFTLMIHPQRTVAEHQVVPRELILILDTSGSMRGFPMQKSKDAMRLLIRSMRPMDTFNVVRFAGDTGTLWSQPRPYTQENAVQALAYVEQMRGSGGTEMRKGILEALAQPAAEGYLRIAFLLTDGYVGDERRILKAIEQHRRGARVFTLGVGSSPNRYLLDRAAEVGRGEAFYLRQDEPSEDVIRRFSARVSRPALAHIEIDWGDLDVEELVPSRIPDLWAGQPILVHGRYRQGGKSRVVVRGQLGSRSYTQVLDVHLPRDAAGHEAIASVWARNKIRGLMLERTRKGDSGALVDAVTQLGLSFRLMTQWTSFVAVEECVVNEGGETRTVVQPVELPEGVAYEGVFGPLADATAAAPAARLAFRGVLGKSAGSRGLRMNAATPAPELSSATGSQLSAGETEEPRKEDADIARCRIEALSVSGGLRYPNVHAFIQNKRDPLCRTLNRQGATLRAVAVSLKVRAGGSVDEVLLTEAGSGKIMRHPAIVRLVRGWRLPGAVGTGGHRVSFVLVPGANGSSP